MRDETRLEIDAWWCEHLDVDPQGLWRTVTVHRPRGRLGEHEGWYVVWRGDGVHVSAPPSADAADIASLSASGPVDLQQAAFWQGFAQARSMRVLGPAVHHYLDLDPGVPDDVEQVDPARLTLLRDTVSPDEWDESGVGDALADGGEALALWGATGETDRPWVPALLGGAVLTSNAGPHRDVGLLVAGDARGRGIGGRLGRAAASYAVTWHGWARWTAQVDNEPSLRAAGRLGFEPYATALRVKP